MRPSRHQRRLWPSGPAGIAALMLLSGCASLGGNVKGSFSCAAPDGICAPSSTIDDRALALISDDASQGAPLPTGDGGRPARTRVNRAAIVQPARLATADPARTQEKVLRIVFQPYIDDRGRFHEASAVRAVVARGEWQEQALLQPGSAQRLAVAAPGSAETLADAVDRADPPADGLLAVDPGVPDPAAVAAARARKADPVGAIKADVAARLAPKPPVASSAAAGALAHPSPAAASPPLQPPSGAATGGSPERHDAAAAGHSGSGQTAADRAVARVKADPRYREVADGAASGAKNAAAAQSGAQTMLPMPGTTVKAASFPAAVPEDR